MIFMSGMLTPNDFKVSKEDPTYVRRPKPKKRRGNVQGDLTSSGDLTIAFEPSSQFEISNSSQSL